MTTSGILAVVTAALFFVFSTVMDFALEPEKVQEQITQGTHSYADRNE